jgi:preprotein translocase subunit SecA
MRIFGGERLSSIMKGLNIPEDMPIESSVVSRSIEAAQRKIEGFNFDTRKHLLEYDDVLNKHRETVYRHRKNILEMNGENLRQEVLKMVKNEITKIITFHFQGEEKGKWDFKNVIEIIKNIFPLENTANEKIAEIIKNNDSHSCRNQIIEYFFDLADQAYNVLEKKVEAAREKLDSSSQPGSLMAKIAKSILLQSIDHYWIDHLEIIDNLKGGIGLRAYGQQDPLVEYKKESFTKFNQLMDSVSKQVVYSIYKIGLVDGLKKPPTKEIKLNGPRVSSAPNRPKGQEKVGRNDPCPCGAKKPDGTPIKYKHCCGKDI